MRCLRTRRSGIRDWWPACGGRGSPSYAIHGGGRSGGEGGRGGGYVYEGRDGHVKEGMYIIWTEGFTPPRVVFPFVRCFAFPFFPQFLLLLC